MQIEVAQPESISALTGILHDLCQPLTALECSLELALLPSAAGKVQSLTATALAAARRLHTLANQMQQIDRMCRNYRRPRVLAFAEIAVIFNLTSDETGNDANLYLDIAGLGYAIQQLPRIRRPLSGSIHRLGTIARITIAIAAQISEDPSPNTLLRALVEHLGGQLTLTENEAVFQFLIH